MTASEALAMNEDTPRIGGQIGRVLLFGFTGLCAVFGGGVIAGVIAGAIERGNGFDMRTFSLIAAAALFVALALWAAMRAGRSLNAAAGAPTTRERRGRIVMLACIAIGMGLGMAVMLAAPTPHDIFSGAPLPAGFALPIALLIAVPLPALCYYWHMRVADEQEADAYRTAAMLALYAFWIAAPVWWLLWRGGLAPAPDGVALYLLTIVVAGIFWLTGKYR